MIHFSGQMGGGGLGACPPRKLNFVAICAQIQLLVQAEANNLQ